MIKMANIVETAIKAGNFKTLVKAVQAAGLVDTLSKQGPFTVFAPTDDAFAKVPASTLNTLLAKPNDLKKVLLYHAISGKIMSTDLYEEKKVKTVQGSEVKINAVGGVKVNDAKVVKANIECDNGVIHVIDKVILPP
jgi:uncharacterized surface protein with fasciclin (FAS1) repeats